MMDIDRFIPVSRAIRAGIALVSTKNITIDDPELKRVFAIVCEELNTYTDTEEQRAFMKKSALILLSKIGGDTAYNSFMHRVAVRIVEEKLFTSKSSLL